MSKSHDIRNYFMEKYKCDDCDYEMIIWRNKGQRREKRHPKKLFCVGCNLEKNLFKVDEHE